MIEKILQNYTINGFQEIYNVDILPELINIRKTIEIYSKDGDFTITTFPLVKFSKKSPEITGNELGNYLKKNLSFVESFGVIKGFLNIKIKSEYWVEYLKNNCFVSDYGLTKIDSDAKPVIIEFSSPNTNKPLHLGHIRNNLIGNSVAEILKANGHNVIKVNLVNDRGIHICKSMLAWEKWGNNETPESSGIKGDFLVGKYYVLFDKCYKEEIADLVAKGIKEEDAKKQAPLIIEAQDKLRKWESNDKATIDLWKKMNEWVYNGFDKTYYKLGIKFNKTYHESETYLLGKKIVENALSKGLINQKPDNSIWIDLTNEGLDEKLLLRSDGTSVYMTQDLGTADLRYQDYNPESMIFVVGNEQNYHFDVLKKTLKHMGFDWADIIHHLSYGMVELPEGKMKSREGTVVDADDLIVEMVNTAKEMTEELGKTDDFTTEEAGELYRKIGLGALKYFILKVDPEKNMVFNPKESIDFNGNTGPFIQYTYARIKSLLRKADFINNSLSFGDDITLNEVEKELIKLIYEFPQIINEAGQKLSPALIASYAYELAKTYNSFYQKITILKEEDESLMNFRLLLSGLVAEIIKNSLGMLGIEVPERM